MPFRQDHRPSQCGDAAEGARRPDARAPHQLGLRDLRRGDTQTYRFELARAKWVSLRQGRDRLTPRHSHHGERAGAHSTAQRRVRGAWMSISKGRIRAWLLGLPVFRGCPGSRNSGGTTTNEHHVAPKRPSHPPLRNASGIAERGATPAYEEVGDYRTLREGDIDPEFGKRIEYIVYADRDYIVFLDSDARTLWSFNDTRYGTLCEGAGTILNRVSALAYMPTDALTRKQLGTFNKLIAGAIARLLGDRSITQAAQALDAAERWLSARNNEVARVWYLSASSVVALPLLAIGVGVYVWRTALAQRSWRRRSRPTCYWGRLRTLSTHAHCSSCSASLAGLVSASSPTWSVASRKCSQMGIVGSRSQPARSNISHRSPFSAMLRRGLRALPMSAESGCDARSVRHLSLRAS